MKDLTLSHVPQTKVTIVAFVMMPQNMETIVIKNVKLEKKLKSSLKEVVANVLESKLEQDLKFQCSLLILIVRIVNLAIIPKENVTKNVLKKLIPMEQKILVKLAIPQSKPVT
jgi:predicted house-cleaning noncanonical NTP pyrophosphatase (MazG superfamily)